MSTKKYFKRPIISPNTSPMTYRAGKSRNGVTASYGQTPNLLQESYLGCPNRIERYQQLELMANDSTVATALDIIAQFSTQANPNTGLCFKVDYNEEATPTEISIISERLRSWYYLNELHKRIFRIFRNVLKYGDQVFIRDPETFKLNYVEMDNVIKVIVNESKGKEPEQYVLRNISPNFMTLVASEVRANDIYNMVPSGPLFSTSITTGAGMQSSPYSSGSRFTLQKNEAAIDASNILHLSLTEGLDSNWPFGTSILESVFKVYKQKEMLEDSIVIYRIQRAPSRRVFTIDVGDMAQYQISAYIEKLKTEMYQRRIPSYNQNGAKFSDTSYQSMAINEDFFLPKTSAGRGSTVDQLQEGMNLGEINDLRYFDNKMMRGLQIPSSYIPIGPEDGSQPIQDGKVGVALIQEYCFNQYCERLQRLVCDLLDLEFKAYLKWCGVSIDSSIFTLSFNPPQNFAHYRQVELDSAKINTFSSLVQYPFLSKRFLMKRFLGLTEDEMAENAKLFGEELPEEVQSGNDGANMRDIGVTPGGIDNDLGNFPDMPDLDETPDMGEGGESAPEASPEASPDAGAEPEL